MHRYFLKLILASLLPVAALAEQVQITAPLPLPVSGTFTTSPSTATANVVSTYTVITSTYPINVSGSFSFNPPAVTTVTFNGIGQPTTSTMTVITSTYSINTNVTNTVPVTGTFFQATQPVSGAGTFIVTNSTNPLLVTSTGTQAISGTVGATQSGTWNVNSTQVNVATITHNNIGQPVTSTSTVVTSTYSLNVNLTNTPSVSQSGTWTIQVGNTQNTVPIQTISTGTVITSTYSINVAVTNTPTVNAAQSGTWTTQVGNTQNTVPIQTISTATVVTSTYSLNMAMTNSPTVILGAGTTNIGKIVYQTPTTAALSSVSISSSTVGDNVIVSTQTSQTIRVFRMLFTVSAATTLTFKSGGATSLSGAISLNTNGAVVLDFSGEPWYITAASQAFIINQTGSATIAGTFWYTQS